MPLPIIIMYESRLGKESGTVLQKQTSTDMINQLFFLLERYPEEMREIIMTTVDKANICAAAFFAHQVAHLENISPQEQAEVILTYIETIWMAGFEAGYERSRLNSEDRNLDKPPTAK